jgi:hypothetical protein
MELKCRSLLTNHQRKERTKRACSHLNSSSGKITPHALTESSQANPLHAGILDSPHLVKGARGPGR